MYTSHTSAHTARVHFCLGKLINGIVNWDESEGEVLFDFEFGARQNSVDLSRGCDLITL